MIEIALVAVIALVVVVGVWFYSANSQTATEITPLSPSPTPPPIIISEYEYKTYDEITIDPSIPLLDGMEPKSKYIGINKYGQNLTILEYDDIPSNKNDIDLTTQYKQRLVENGWEITIFNTNPCTEISQGTCLADWGYLEAIQNNAKIIFNTDSIQGISLTLVNGEEQAVTLKTPDYFPSNTIASHQIDAVFTNIHRQGGYNLHFLLNISMEEGSDIVRPLYANVWNEDCGETSVGTGAFGSGCLNPKDNTALSLFGVTSKHHPTEQLIIRYSANSNPGTSS